MVALGALLLAQALGAMHRVVHPKAAPGVPTSWSVPAAGTLHGFAALFAGHLSEHGCDLFDQSSHGDLLHGALPVLAWQPPGQPPALVAPDPELAAEVAAARARGPPSTTS